MVFDVLIRLREEIDAVAPIDGLDVEGQTVTQIHFRPEATAAQRVLAEAIASAFDWSQAATESWAEGKEPLLRDLRDQAESAITAIDSYLVIAPTATAAQVRAEVEAIDRRQKRVIQALARLIRRTWRG